MWQFPLYLFKDHITTAIFLKDPMIAATALRLSFHDCVGGCDGCVNMGIGANVGLGRIFHMLTKDWEEHRDTIGKNLSQLSKNYLLGSLVNGMAWARVGFLLEHTDTNSQSPGSCRERGSRKSGSPSAELEVAAATKTNSTT